ncbi:MAG: sigma-70 family RNA polymerase sigma factor [Chloroflexota bacterium]
MNKHEAMAERFEANRTHLWAVAYRMLGSVSEAEDAVQESWLRLSRADTSGVENMSGWLTTVVARVCLDMLRSRNSRREDSLAEVPEPVVSRENAIDPEHEAVLADSVGIALLVVLDTLNPSERLAFVLHDIFAVPFVEIAPIVGRSPAAARQLASRARRRVRGASTGSRVDLRPLSIVPEGNPNRRREIVSAFLAASRAGDFDALLSMLDPDVVLRADQTAVAVGANNEVSGAAAVAGTFAGRARVAQLALVDGVVEAVWAQGGQPRVVFSFTITEGKIVEINLLADPERLNRLDLTILNDRRACTQRV